MAKDSITIWQRFARIFKRNNIRGRYMQIIVPMILVVLTAADIVIYQLIKSGNRQSTHEMAIQTMTIQANNVENIFLSYLNELDIMANIFSRQNYTPKQSIEECIKVLEGKEDSYYLLRYTTPDGISYTSRGPDSTSMKGRKYFKDIFEKQLPFAIEYPFNPIPGDTLKCYSVTVPVYDNQKKRKASLTLAFEINIVNKYAEAMKIDGMGNGTLVNDEMTIVAFPDHSKINEINFLTPGKFVFKGLDKMGKMLQELKEGQGVDTVYAGEIPLLIYYSKLPKINWQVGVLIAEPALYQAEIKLKILFAITGFITLLLLAIGILIATKSIVLQPIIAINEFTDDFASGRLYSTATSAIKSNDELGKLNSYKRLWHILLDKNMLKKDLEALAGITHYQMTKLSKDENVTTEVIGKICKALNCTPDDIMEFIIDEN